MDNQEIKKEEIISETKNLPSEQEINKFNDIIQKLNDIESKFSELSFTNKNVELKPQEENIKIKEEFKLG